MRFIIVFVMTLGGCGAEVTAAMDAGTDLARDAGRDTVKADDLKEIADLAESADTTRAADLTRTEDLETRADLMSQEDLSIVPDLMVTQDLFVAPDLGTLPDLTPQQDLSLLPDLTPQQDLSLLPDLTPQQDLSPLPDLTQLADLTSAPDLTPQNGSPCGGGSGIYCGGICYSTTDSNNCGGCGVQCDINNTCVPVKGVGACRLKSGQDCAPDSPGTPGATCSNPLYFCTGSTCASGNCVAALYTNNVYLGWHCN